MAADRRNRAVFHVLRRMRTPLLVLIIVYGVSMLGLTLIPGVDPDGRPYHLDFFHSFYVVTYTITTIGFGEIPHPFTGAQRLWVTFSMYLGVVAWVYAIGRLVTLVQDPALRQMLAESRFAGSVRRLATPFYIVCGYGDTGAQVVRDMTEHGLQPVTIDIDPNSINELALEDLRAYVPGLCADAALPATLVLAGLHHPHCRGVVAITQNDAVNLKIAISAKLLNPALNVICRAGSHDTEANMASFGTDAVINPFDVFADRLGLGLHAPNQHLLHEWLTRPPGEPLPLRYRPPHGTWVLCGYGRFGKAVHRHLQYEGIASVIIEATPEQVQAPPETIRGRGTEAVTLREARIEQAVGIVAGTDDDANNLSIIMTARELNPNLFLVVRQNRSENDAIFEAAKVDLTMQRARIIANAILARISTPLLAGFLRLARHQSNDWAGALIERLWPLTANHTPDLWTVEINSADAPAVIDRLATGHEAQLGHLLADPAERERQLRCVALLLVRGEKEILLPEDKVPLKTGDRILFCGLPGMEGRMQRTLHNPASLHYVVSGEVKAEGWLWRRLAGH